MRLGGRGGGRRWGEAGREGRAAGGVRLGGRGGGGTIKVQSRNGTTLWSYDGGFMRLGPPYFVIIANYFHSYGKKVM